MIKFFRSIVKSFKDINEKYKNPEIQPSKAVNFALLMLRIYLLALVGLLVFRFITMLKLH